jgi:hypothetical protein
LVGVFPETSLPGGVCGTLPDDVCGRSDLASLDAEVNWVPKAVCPLLGTEKEEGNDDVGMLVTTTGRPAEDVPVMRSTVVMATD